MLNENQTLLAIDTATPRCSVALLHRQTVYEKHSQGEERQTEVILPLINALLNEAGIGIADVGGIVVSAGPGAFTGLRVGASVAIGLACARDTPICEISSLALLAATVLQNNRDKIVVPVFDARMKQVYAGKYRLNDGAVQALADDVLCNPDVVDLAGADIVAGAGCVYREQFSRSDLIIDGEVLPDAQYAFMCLAGVRWHSPFESVELRYLRNEVTG